MRTVFMLCRVALLESEVFVWLELNNLFCRLHLIAALRPSLVARSDTENEPKLVITICSFLAACSATVA